MLRKFWAVRFGSVDLDFGFSVLDSYYSDFTESDSIRFNSYLIQFRL